MLFICCFFYNGYTQSIPEAEKEKLSPLINEKLTSADPEKKTVFIIVAKDSAMFLNFLAIKSLPVKIIRHYGPGNIFLVNAKWSDIKNKLLNSDLVSFIDEVRKPEEELAVSGFDLGVNKVNVVHNEFPEYTGAGAVVSVMENKMDTADIDFEGRFQSTYLSSPIYSSHASIMATMIAGAGNTFFESKGAALGSTITSSSFATLLPDADAAYQEFNISVQNHSYGTGIENFYGADAAAYDLSAINNYALMHIFSAGNSGTLTDTIGNYHGVTNYANITGSFKMAKNIITVGATDSFGLVVPLSSKGPAYDGRVKPELVAFGQDGSSGAAAIVSGTALLLQQAYKENHSGALPASALVKAVLINSANDVETKNIDYKSGYGSLNSYKAMITLLAENYFSGSAANKGLVSYSLHVPENTGQLKMTLVWNDPAAAPNASKALINDLDMELQLPEASQIWEPWLLNTFPNPDSLALLPSRGRDSLNNVEQITIENPKAGDYIINVSGFNVATSLQQFFVAFQMDSASEFKWYYPGRLDNVFSGDANIIRWEPDFLATMGELSFSNDGVIWKDINDSVDLTRGYLKWLVPDTFSRGILRMNINGQYFYSDTFTISLPLRTFVGFNCTDSFMFYWNKVPGILNYECYHLGNRYMEPFALTRDTTIILDKANNPSTHYAVAPLLENKVGLRSYAFDYNTQGVACYIKTFSAALIDGSSVEINLLLGTILEIVKITWEKYTPAGYLPLQAIVSLSGLEYSYLDGTPGQGENVYRAAIELSNGQTIYSQPESVYYLNNNVYVIYPDPALRSGTINIISREVNDAVAEIINSSGEMIMRLKLDDILVSIPTDKLNNGLYMIHITNGKASNELLKLVVY
ncbi:MAG: S8 family peptidase [Chitinophagales bacterium]|nr:S8 family peptidase [Chitinophagales bacterium]